MSEIWYWYRKPEPGWRFFKDGNEWEIVSSKKIGYQGCALELVCKIVGVHLPASEQVFTEFDMLPIALEQWWYSARKVVFNDSPKQSPASRFPTAAHCQVYSISLAA